MTTHDVVRHDPADSPDDRYDPGMTVKITVSLPDDLVAQARRAVADERATSVSAYVAEAMRAHGGGESLSAILDDLDAQHGQPSEDVLAWADRQLGLTET